MPRAASTSAECIEMSVWHPACAVVTCGAGRRGRATSFRSQSGIKGLKSGHAGTAVAETRLSLMTDPRDPHPDTDTAFEAVATLSSVVAVIAAVAAGAGRPWVEEGTCMAQVDWFVLIWGPDAAVAVVRHSDTRACVGTPVTGVLGLCCACRVVCSCTAVCAAGMLVMASVSARCAAGTFMAGMLAVIDTAPAKRAGLRVRVGVWHGSRCYPGLGASLGVYKNRESMEWGTRKQRQQIAGQIPGKLGDTQIRAAHEQHMQPVGSQRGSRRGADDARSHNNDAKRVRE